MLQILFATHGLVETMKTPHFGRVSPMPEPTLSENLHQTIEGIYRHVWKSGVYHAPAFEIYNLFLFMDFHEG